MSPSNGREFVASVVQEITNLWPGLHCAPRRPQTQGCVERGNGDLQLKLGKWLDQHGGTWSTALQLVTHAINTSNAAATGKTPYEVVSGLLPRRDFFILEQLSNQTNGPLLEENMTILCSSKTKKKMKKKKKLKMMKVPMMTKF